MLKSIKWTLTKTHHYTIKIKSLAIFDPVLGMLADDNYTI